MTRVTAAPPRPGYRGSMSTATQPPAPASPPSAPLRADGGGARPAAPGPGGLAAAGSPPLRLPGEHFAAALLFWLAGSAGLVWAAPEIARGAFPLPRVAAVTHLFTLGWITTSILGALCQFLPVALGTPIRSTRLAHLSFALHVPGVALFVAGLLTGRHAAMLGGAACFGSGLLLFAGNLAATLRRAPERNLTWWALAAADAYLATTVVLGASLAGNLRWGYLGGERFLALGVHLHVAVAGWVLLVMAGVAHRLLPMFLLSHGATERPGRIAVALLAGGTAILVGFHHFLAPWTVWTVAALLGGGLVAFLAQAAAFFRARKKPALDAGLRLAAAGAALLGAALLLAPFWLARGLAAPGLATAYVLALLLGVSLFVAGHYYKILPFLVWLHRFGPLVGRKQVPRVADLYAARPANAAAALLAMGAAGMVGATLAGSAEAARVAALLYAAGAAVVAVQMLGISRRRPG